METHHKHLNGGAHCPEVRQAFARQVFFRWKLGCILGTIFHIEAHSARDISAFSLFPNEKEAILLPDFRAVVTGPITVDALGFRHVPLRELPNSAEPTVAHATCKEKLQRIIERNQHRERKIARIERKEALLKSECDHINVDVSHELKARRQRFQTRVYFSGPTLAENIPCFRH